MTLTEQKINKNFLIRFKAREEESNKLIPFSLFQELVSSERLEKKLLYRIWEAGEDECTVKLRRGIEFTFVAR